MNKTSFTGERFIPGCFAPGSEIYDAHMARYEFASTYVKNKKVLDISSGEGYGSFLLAQTALEVYGVDIDTETVKRATDKYQKNNIFFSVGSAENLKFSNNYFDIVVSFETIEHLDSNSQLLFLKEVKRILKVDGKFIISTPDKDIYGSEHNEFHVDEFNKKEFVNILNSFFVIEKLYGQGIKKSRSIFFSIFRLIIDTVRSTNVWKKIKNNIPHILRRYVDVITSKYSQGNTEHEKAQEKVVNEYFLQEVVQDNSAKYLIALCCKRNQ